VVAGVEVSLDGGGRWHPAQGRENWSYEGTIPAGIAHATIVSRAADDSGNVEEPGTTVTVTIGSDSTN
jgi:hypothetical protein